MNRRDAFKALADVLVCWLGAAIGRAAHDVLIHEDFPFEVKGPLGKAAPCDRKRQLKRYHPHARRHTTGTLAGISLHAGSGVVASAESSLR